ncbi:MAG: tetratricopeptide repeat protein [Promethearchaeota archaeon]|jgi:tetratricopeptide (TPR) repeat protein
MSIPFTEKLDHGWQLFNEGKVEEALKIVSEIEEIQNLTPIENLECQLLKGIGFQWTRNYKKALNLAKHIVKEGVKLGRPLISIEAISLIKFAALWFLGRQPEILKDIKFCKDLLESFPHTQASEFETAKILFITIRGYFAFWEGKLDRVLEDYLESLPFYEQSTRFSFALLSHLNILGATYAIKGELDLGIKYLLRSLDVSKGLSTIFSRNIEAGSLNFIGSIYHKKGNLDLAIEYFEKSLNVWEQHNDPIAISFINLNYTQLIKVSLDQDSLKRAKNYLEGYKSILEKLGLPLTEFQYQLSYARILRSSPRTHDKAEAENILKELIKVYDVWVNSGYRPIPTENPAPIIDLCELYLDEFYSTHDLGILNDIQPLITRLITASEGSKNYSLLSETNLLQGRISLLRMNMGDARLYLTRAQEIAEEYGLQLLAQSISKEHDKLLEQLDKFENTDKRYIDLSESQNLTSLEELMARMQGKRVIKAPELVNEDPLLLLIITEGGVPVFSYPFADEWNREDDLFASFLSAITSFSSEFFSEGLDRMKFGKYTVLMKSMGELSSCYLFKGQTYLAKQKLTRFIEGIQNNNSIMQALMKFYQASQVVELKDFPFLEAYIKEIFITTL